QTTLSTLSLHDALPILIGVRDDRSSAVAAGGAQVVQTLQVAALALPVADRVVHELELRHFAEILDGKHRRKHRLRPAVLALARQDRKSTRLNSSHVSIS